MKKKEKWAYEKGLMKSESEVPTLKEKKFSRDWHWWAMPDPPDFRGS